MLAVSLGLASCGSPGDPTPPRIPVPEAVKDLSARQQGESVLLSFTLPTATVDGDALEAPPDVEIHRAFVPAGKAVPKDLALTLVYTVPSALVDTYLTDGRMTFADPFKTDALAKHAGEQVFYGVSTRVSKRRASDHSNLISVRLLPTPAPIADLSATLTETAVELRWSPPERMVTGASVASLSGYRIYRAEAGPGETEGAKSKAPAELLGVSPTAAYRDTQFEFGKNYIYSVRSVAQFEADSVESADSNPARLEARDIFPPAAPKNVVLVPVAGTAETPAHVELSWSISAETDLAGYHVYRSEAGGPTTRVSRELLLTPTFRDMSILTGRSYTYSVTAVDRAGNESAPGAPVSFTVPAPDSNEKAKP